MRYLKLFLLGWVLLALGGCNGLPNASDAGLVSIAPNVYVEPVMDGMSRRQLAQATADAEQAIGAAYGSVRTHPPIYACATDGCYTHMGGSMGSTAEALDDRIVLSPGGLNWHFIAHEWSHAELFSRLTPATWQRMPQWFNEGLAVAISQEPEYSENAWQYVLANNLPCPRYEELRGLRTLPQWSDAVSYYNQQNESHRARGEMEVAPVYAAAGHVVRPWLARVGSAGLSRLIQRMNAGAPFDAVF
ncbi:MAG: hypothetical protein PHE17_17050 [Thiothrix sp.]|uniref:hypothetical protein n=1 Tax=Thiothrix sp. TaxID=1032 RepID=UPI002626AFE6|nr:hypothetical protein [Thiothrix sp.]MDD5394726.1 hypothetical protein [Thiothrix sp.]